MIVRRSFSKRPTRRRSSLGQKKNCSFCQKKREPSYKEVEVLKNFISDRAKILRSENTGLCQKHQRRVSKAIKQARFLSLLPFTTQITR